MPGIGAEENGVCDGLFIGFKLSRCALPFGAGCSLVIGVTPVGGGERLLCDGDLDLYLKLTLRPRRTFDPALGRPFFLGGSGPAPLMLALRFDRRLDVSPSSRVCWSSGFTLRGVGGGGERLGDGD